MKKRGGIIIKYLAAPVKLQRAAGSDPLTVGAWKNTSALDFPRATHRRVAGHNSRSADAAWSQGSGLKLIFSQTGVSSMFYRTWPASGRWSSSPLPQNTHPHLTLK
ncbi:hypothetical protein HAX54_018197, partial [Datura stramonium]|nr:hypothetical protein [Datura stramonium]